MGESYGIVTAVTDGQEGVGGNSYKNYYTYDLVHEDAIGYVEISKTVFLNGPFQYRITVDRTGYYLFRANVLNEDSVNNKETGETTRLIGYFALKDKKGKVIEKYYFSNFRETIALKSLDSYNGIAIGYGPDDVKRPMRYKVIMYLEADIVYTGQLNLSSKNNDNECILRLSPNADIYQYDSKKFVSNSENESLITQLTKYVIGEGFITKPMNKNERKEVYANYLMRAVAEDGINSVLMWMIDPNKALPLERNRTLTTISEGSICVVRLYVDQFLGAWLYRVVDACCTFEVSEEEQNASFIKSILEFMLSTAVGKINEIISGLLSIGSGAANTYKDTRTNIEKLRDALLKHIDDDFQMKTPLVIYGVCEQMKRYGANVIEYEFPVYAWDGSVNTALGDTLCCGKFVYNKFTPDDLVEFKQTVDNLFKGED